MVHNPFAELFEKLDLINKKLDDIIYWQSKIVKKDEKEFLTPKEFGRTTGISYHKVVNYCRDGKLKATQEAPNCAWMIRSSEVERYKQEANRNI